MPSLSLRYKIGGVMLLLSLIPLGIVSALTINSLFTRLNEFSQRLQQTEHNLRDNIVGRNLSAAAADTAAEIDTYLLERIGDIRRWSEESILIQAAQQGSQQAVTLGLAAQPQDKTAIETALQGSFFIPIQEQTFSESVTFLFRQIELQPIFTEILITNAYGINVLITRPTEGVTHSTAEWWQQASATNRAGIGITPVFIDSVTNRPTIGIALPIFDPNSKDFLGVIRALLDLTELQQRVSRKAISSTAEIRVYNQDGFLVMDTATNHDPARILLPQSALASQPYPPAELALATVPGPANAGFTRDVGASQLPTEAFIVGYAHSADHAFYDEPAQLLNFPGFQWAITVSQPEQTALQVLQPLIQTGQDFSALPQTLTQLFIFVSLSAGSISLIVALLFATSITRPLIELSQLAGRVQNGDLSVQVQTTKAWRAVAAALEMRRRLQTLNQKRIARGEAPILSGIGISAGEAVAGQIGSLERLLYTVIGDAVNVAARLESLTKDYPNHPILINGYAAQELAPHTEIKLHSLGPIMVKGRSEPVEVFAVQE